MKRALTTLIAATMLASSAPASAQETRGAGVKANLDLPFEAAAEEEEESLPPDVWQIGGQLHEGDAIFFVCDRSGSMSGAKLRKVQEELARNLVSSSERLQFGIIFFEAGVLKFPASGSPAHATPGMKSAALSWLYAMQSSRGVANSCYKEGLMAALQLASRSSARKKVIILLGDGVAACGGQDPQTYGEETRRLVAEANVEKVQINTVCVGRAGAADEKWMQQLARENRGAYSRIVE